MAEVAAEVVALGGREIMSRKTRFAAVLLLLVFLPTASLEAIPLGFRITPATNPGGDFLSAVVEWIASVFGPERLVERTPKTPQKDNGTLDPNGTGGGH